MRRLDVVLVFVVICSLHPQAQGLRCYSCSNKDFCEKTIKNHPVRVGRCRVNDGKCFVRKDPNGELHWGCLSDALWPGVPWRTYVDCAEDPDRGWIHNGVFRPAKWCVCDDRDDCNVEFRDVKSHQTTTSSTTTSATATVTAATDDGVSPETQETMRNTPPMMTTTTSENVTCPADFVQVTGETSCYKVVSPTINNTNVESRDYEQASRACQSSGAHLVSIESLEEQQHLADFLRTQPHILQGWQGWWTSGQLVPNTNVFIWSNSRTLVDPSLWGFVQSPVHDTCLWIMSIPYFNYSLGNYDCSTRAGYICEIDMP